MAANRQTDRHTYIHTHASAKWSHASVGLAQAHPNYLLGESSLWIQQLSPGMLSIDSLAVRALKLHRMSKLFVEISK